MSLSSTSSTDGARPGTAAAAPALDGGGTGSRLVAGAEVRQHGPRPHRAHEIGIEARIAELGEVRLCRRIQHDDALHAARRRRPSVGQQPAGRARSRCDRRRCRCVKGSPAVGRRGRHVEPRRDRALLRAECRRPRATDAARGARWPDRAPAAHAAAHRPARSAAPSALAGSAARFSRSVAVNVEPEPGSLATRISPPIARARRREMASPSPVPPWRRRTAASACSNSENRAGSASAAMPMPVSSTAMAMSTSSFAVGRLRRAGLADGHEHAAAVGELDGVADAGW